MSTDEHARMSKQSELQCDFLVFSRREKLSDIMSIEDCRRYMSHMHRTHRDESVY